jgi:hypothetical protein
MQSSQGPGFCFRQAIAVAVAAFAGISCTSAIAQEGNSLRVILGVQFEGDSTILSSVTRYGPADKAGLRVGDELFSIDEHAIVQSIDVVRVLSGRNPGDKILVEARRNDEFRFFELTVIRETRPGERIASDGRILPPIPEWGLVHEPIPELDALEWYGLPGGETSPNFGDWRGQVVALVLFQMPPACQYSLEDGLPLMQRLHERYGDDPDVRIIAMQSGFVPNAANTPENALALLNQFDLAIPLANDRFDSARVPAVKKLRARGTPWIILVDREGIVQHNGHPDSITSLDMIEQLKAGTLDSPTAPPPGSLTPIDSAESGPQAPDSGH